MAVTDPAKIPPSTDIVMDDCLYEIFYVRDQENNEASGSGSRKDAEVDRNLAGQGPVVANGIDKGANGSIADGAKDMECDNVSNVQSTVPR